MYRNIKNLKTPVFLLNVPFSLSTDAPNNAWMTELKSEELQVNKSRAIQQWMKLYQFLASHGIVYLLPSQQGLQDQVYVSNLGIVLAHTTENIVVVSNFRTEVRRGETAVGHNFFNSMGFETVIAPQYFEGEADLKYLRDNIYFGAYGMRTSLNALNWLRDTYEMQVIPIKVINEHLYHLDCMVFPITSEKVLVCTELCDKETIRQIEKVAEIIDVDFKLAYGGITNCVRCGEYILCDTALAEFEDKTYDDKHYTNIFQNSTEITRSVIERFRIEPTPHGYLADLERKKVDKLMAICAENELKLIQVNMSEFYKSGALLSCMVMHLNYPRHEKTEIKEIL